MFLKNLTAKVRTRVVDWTNSELCIGIADDATPYSTYTVGHILAADTFLTAQRIDIPHGQKRTWKINFTKNKFKPISGQHLE